MALFTTFGMDFMHLSFLFGTAYSQFTGKLEDAYFALSETKGFALFSDCQKGIHLSAKLFVNNVSNNSKVHLHRKSKGQLAVLPSSNLYAEFYYLDGATLPREAVSANDYFIRISGNGYSHDSDDFSFTGDVAEKSTAKAIGSFVAFVLSLIQ